MDPRTFGDHYGWFLLDYFLTHDFADVIASTNAVFAWIESVKARHSSVSLFGFSQGMAMASTLLRLRPEQFRAARGALRFCPGQRTAGDERIVHARPPFFWGRDKGDVVINDAATEHTEAWLNRNTQLTARTYPGMGHTISKAELVDVGAFLRHYVLRPAADPRTPARCAGAARPKVLRQSVYPLARQICKRLQSTSAMNTGPTTSGGRKGWARARRPKLRA